MREACRNELLEACCLLFGTRLDPAFLEHVQASGLQAAWRRAALQTHPDRTTDGAAKILNGERFIEARRAYGLLREYLGSRAVRRDPAARAPGPCPPRSGQRPQHRARPQRADARRQGESRPCGVVPRRRLRLGEFLYHSRLITFSEMIETLVFQRRQRERFCEIVLRWRLLSEFQVKTLLARRRPLELVGEAAQRLRLLTPPQVRLVLAFQRMRQEPLGAIFVRRGLLSTRHLEEQLARLVDHNSSLRRC